MVYMIYEVNDNNYLIISSGEWNMDGKSPCANIKVGFAPTRRDIFSREDALAYRRKIRERLDMLGPDIIDIDDINDEGLMYDVESASKVARKFVSEGVDAVFAPHCNFGTEEAVATLGSIVKKPLLLWGPRDEAPLDDGLRLRDTQCGLFATSKVLQRFNIPFTYIENCRLEHPMFEREFKTFIAAANVVKRFYGMKIGQVATRPSSFLSVMYNEAELLELFNIHVEPISLLEISGSMKKSLSHIRDDYAKSAVNYNKDICHGCSEDSIVKMLALKDVITRWADREKLDAVAFQCWDAFMDEFGISPCFINSELTGEGLPVVCEMDICGAVSAVMAGAAALDENPIFFADLTVRHPTNDNAELLWHCGSFPYKLKKPESEARVSDHYTLPSGCPGVCEWEIRPGIVSICRFDGIKGKYSLIAAKGRGIDGPHCKGTYLWTEFNDWPGIERRFIYGPYIHHVAGIHGDIIPTLKEALRYMPGITDDLIE